MRPPRRKPLILISAIIATSIIGDALLYNLLPAHPEFFQVKVWQIGILLGVNRIIRLVTNEIAGRLVHKSKNNKLLYTTVIVGGLVTISYAFPFGFIWMLFGRAIWGACWSVLRVQGYTSVLEQSTIRNRGKYFSLFQAAVRFGQGGGVLVGGLMSDILGIPFTYIVFGLLSIALGLVFLHMQHSPFHIKKDTENLANLGSAEKTYSHTSRPNYPIRLWACGLSIALVEQYIATLTGRVVADHIQTLLAAGIGITTVTGLLLGFRSFSSLLIGPGVGILSDRIGRDLLLRLFMILQAAALLGLLLVEHWIPLLLLLIIQLASGIAARLLIYVIAGDLAPSDTPSIHIGRFSSFIDLGTALGPLLGFALYAAYGLQAIVPGAWIIIAAVLLLLPTTKTSWKVDT